MLNIKVWGCLPSSPARFLHFSLIVIYFFLNIHDRFLLILWTKHYLKIFIFYFDFFFLHMHFIFFSSFHNSLFTSYFSFLSFHFSLFIFHILFFNSYCSLFIFHFSFFFFTFHFSVFILIHFVFISFFFTLSLHFKHLSFHFVPKKLYFKIKRFFVLVRNNSKLTNDHWILLIYDCFGILMDDRFFSRVHATLYPALSVGWLVGHSLLFYDSYFWTALLLPKWSRVLKYSPCPPARDFGSRLSGLVQVVV